MEGHRWDWALQLLHDMPKCMIQANNVRLGLWQFSCNTKKKVVLVEITLQFS